MKIHETAVFGILNKTSGMPTSEIKLKKW